MGEKEAYNMLENNFHGQLKNLFDHLDIDEEKGTC